jgi:AsmA-like C-terminal region
LASKTGPLRRSVLIAFTLILIVGAILVSLATRMTPHVRDRAIAALNERFRSEVTLDSLQISTIPRPEVSGAGLTVRHNGRTDVTPLIRIESFSASAGLWGLMRAPLRLKTVEVDRLEISIPPGGVHRPDGEPSGAASSGSVASRLVVDEIVSRTARLEIVPRDASKLPREFQIHHLVMRGLGHGDGAPFEAALTNPQPRGEITTRGTFGPWQADEPSRTPVRGEYDFDAANLDTIKGIGGTLTSHGAYSGVLERIEVKGETDTPDFSVDLAAQPVPLKTTFHAIVDGTNGDTRLERVEARVIETLIVAHGAVVRTKDVKGRRVALDVTIDEGRIEDLLKLAVKAGKPLMTGQVRLTTKFLLPAGDADVIDKLELDGRFSLNEARFSNVNVQEQINSLSQRGKGETANDGPSVVSSLSGTFRMRKGTLTFADLSFAVPGAVVQIAGTYDMKRELLDFRGDLLLDATLEKTTTGWKAVAAKLAQPLFRRPGGGSKLPIKITGPREKPEFGLDVSRAISPG